MLIHWAAVGPIVSGCSRPTIYCLLGLRSVFTKQLIRGLAGVVYLRVLDSTTGYTFTSCVGYFTSPGTD